MFSNFAKLIKLCRNRSCFINRIVVKPNISAYSRFNNYRAAQREMITCTLLLSGLYRPYALPSVVYFARVLAEQCDKLMRDSNRVSPTDAFAFSPWQHDVQKGMDKKAGDRKLVRFLSYERDIFISPESTGRLFIHSRC